VDPAPTSFHLGPLDFHLYGLGLALAAYVAFLYGERRFRARGLSPDPFGRFTIAVLVAGLVGARVAHVATNWSHYSGHLGLVVAVWQGGLSSYGGLALAIPTGYVVARRFWPDHPAIAVADALIPILVAGWALGRILGPQFEVGGGGHLTHQWFGLRYAGQVGKRVPVPIIQSLEDGALWLGLIALERRGRVRPGVITGIGCLVWGIVRTVDETWLLGGGANLGSRVVQVAGLVLAATGLAILARALSRHSVAVRD
jgi:phosphatidylglycerol---prolipoprotein diacylglyceryl transferase